MVTPLSSSATSPLAPDDRNVLFTDSSNPSSVVEAALIPSHFSEPSLDLARSPPLPETIFSPTTQPFADVPPDAGGTLTSTTPGSLHLTTTQMQPHANLVPIALPPAHTVTWSSVPHDALVLNGPRVFVPQVIYQAPSQQNTITAILQAPIIFRAEGSSDWGIPLRDLLSNQPPCLIEGGNQTFTSSGPSISLKVQWPGFELYDKRIVTRDYTPLHRPIKIARLAKLVAKAIEGYIDTISEHQMMMGYDIVWEVGQFGITVDDVVLVSLHQVSKGSWQPQLRLRRVPGVAVY